MVKGLTFNLDKNALSASKGFRPCHPHRMPQPLHAMMRAE